MNSRFLEICVLLISLLKWMILAGLVGMIVGLSSTVFLLVLQKGIEALEVISSPVLFLPIGLALSAWLTTRIAPETQGHGTERVIQAIHQRAGLIHERVVPVKLIATIVTIATGRSAGNIGPCAQIGSGLCSLAAHRLRFNELDRQRIVICGISAGFAAVMGTPVAGALFAVEVLYIGRLGYGVLYPSFVSAFIGYQVSLALGVHHVSVMLPNTPAFSVSLFWHVALAGVVFGLSAWLFVELLKVTGEVSSWLGPRKVLTGLIGGSTLIGVALLFSTQTLGLGWTTITQVLEGGSVVGYVFLLKALATCITLQLGGSGGIILPLLFIGATLGSAFADWLHMDPSMFAALGFVSLFAGATNTPIAAIVLALELFGPGLSMYAALTCSMSYLLTGHRSAIPTQILQETKSPSVHLESVEEIEQATWTISPREHTITHTLLRLWRKYAKPPE